MREENDSSAIRTTGQLRVVLAKAAADVISGTMDIDRALALHKLSKNIAESLYSETKIAIFSKEAGADIHAMGDLPLGGTEEAS